MQSLSSSAENVAQSAGLQNCLDGGTPRPGPPLWNRRYSNLDPGWAVTTATGPGFELRLGQ